MVYLVLVESAPRPVALRQAPRGGVSKLGAARRFLMKCQCLMLGQINGGTGGCLPQSAQVAGASCATLHAFVFPAGWPVILSGFCKTRVL